MSCGEAKDEFSLQINPVKFRQEAKMSQCAVVENQHPMS